MPESTVIPSTTDTSSVLEIDKKKESVRKGLLEFYTYYKSSSENYQYILNRFNDANKRTGLSADEKKFMNDYLLLVKEANSNLIKFVTRLEEIGLDSLTDQNCAILAEPKFSELLKNIDGILKEEEISKLLNACFPLNVIAEKTLNKNTVNDTLLNIQKNLKIFKVYIKTPEFREKTDTLDNIFIEGELATNNDKVKYQEKDIGQLIQDGIARPMQLVTRLPMMVGAILKDVVKLEPNNPVYKTILQSGMEQVEKKSKKINQDLRYIPQQMEIFAVTDKIKENKVDELKEIRLKEIVSDKKMNKDAKLKALEEFPESPAILLKKAEVHLKGLKAGQSKIVNFFKSKKPDPKQHESAFKTSIDQILAAVSKDQKLLPAAEKLIKKLKSVAQNAQEKQAVVLLNKDISNLIEAKRNKDNLKPKLTAVFENISSIEAANSTLEAYNKDQALNSGISKAFKAKALENKNSVLADRNGLINQSLDTIKEGFQLALHSKDDALFEQVNQLWKYLNNTITDSKAIESGLGSPCEAKIAEINGCISSWKDMKAFEENLESSTSPKL